MYDYRCTACDAVIEDIMLPYDQRDIPLTEPCPLCEAANSIERIPSAPALGDAFRLGRANLPTTWTDKLARMKKNNLRSTINVPQPGKREI
jgi:hypothetical protein